MDYSSKAAEKLNSYRQSDASGRIVLALETSCDETAAAVVKDGTQVLGTAVHTQIPIHRLYGGVVPEIASRAHAERISSVVQSALENASLQLSSINAIAVTCAPGLIGALIVGVSYAKGLALALGLPLVGVNHIAGHIAANYITRPELAPPFTCLVASGGHSHIVHVKDYNEFELIGRTRDDAAGEAFDKVARMLNLPYPGGPELERLALSGNPHAYKLHAAFNEGESDDFSFSGIKTAVMNLVHNARMRQESISYADIAASFQRAVVDALSFKAVRAALNGGTAKLALAGGVSANMSLRRRLADECAKHSVNFFCPELQYCTDNAAMIATQAHHMLCRGISSPLSLDPSAASFLS